MLLTPLLRFLGQTAWSCKCMIILFLSLCPSFCLSLSVTVSVSLSLRHCLSLYVSLCLSCLCHCLCFSLCTSLSLTLCLSTSLYGSLLNLSLPSLSYPNPTPVHFISFFPKYGVIGLDCKDLKSFSCSAGRITIGIVYAVKETRAEPV